MEEKYVEFTKEMRDEGYTILCPTMLPLHFEILINIFRNHGYNIKQLRNQNANVIAEGLRNTHNDTCYPALLVIGQFMDAIENEGYDPHKIALLMTQTGGGCRASNYISLIRKALKKQGYGYIPVISFNVLGLEKHSGFKLNLKIILEALYAVLYGDLLMNLSNQCRPYEVNKGETDALAQKWTEYLSDQINREGVSYKTVKKNYELIIRDFRKIERIKEEKVKVGVVGEILVKYHPDANNNIVDIIENEGGEAVVLDLIDFFLYGMYSKKFNYEKLSGSYKQYKLNELGIDLIEWFRKPMRKALRESKRFDEPSYIEHTAEEASQIASIGNQCGEGWLLTGEMIELIKSGATNIACLQPFACLPNHVTGKGMMKAIRERFPKANIVAIDYDPGASNVNQLNRIKLMMSQAHKNME